MSGLAEWKGLAVSVIGTEHVRREQPLQDASGVISAPRPAAVVCDGAGSARFSHVGAEAAVREFRISLAALEPMLAACLDSDETTFDGAKGYWRCLSYWMCRAIVAAKEESARVGSGNARDYDFTMAAAVVGQMRTAFLQVGDGAIAVRLRRWGGSALVFRPEKGPYANVTKFLDRDAVEEDEFQTRVLPTSAISGIMVMSDGPEIKMLDMSGNRPAKIVSDMIDDCAKGDLDRASLLNYLTGSRWMNDPRGGDDKSVAILALTNTRKGKQKEH
jgi:hypothetical protein